MKEVKNIQKRKVSVKEKEQEKNGEVICGDSTTIVQETKFLTS